MGNHDDFDLVVLGGGSGGYAAALRAAELGMRVALIEKDKLGGTCLHRGCIPTKAMLQSAEVVETIKESATFGVSAAFQNVDLAGVGKYKDGIVTALFRGLSGLVASRGIELIEGTGRLSSPNSIAVTLNERRPGASGVRRLICSSRQGRFLGRSSVSPSMEQRIITSDDALVLEAIPRSVIILGGGAIGCEFATVWNSFGAKVTIVEAFPHLVPLEDEAASKSLEKAFKRHGIEFRRRRKGHRGNPDAGRGHRTP